MAYLLAHYYQTLVVVPEYEVRNVLGPFVFAIVFVWTCLRMWRGTQEEGMGRDLQVLYLSTVDILSNMATLLLFKLALEIL
jgi:hypothetical protein